MNASDIPGDWRAAIAPTLALPGVARLFSHLAAEEAAGAVIYPPAEQRFRALALTPLAGVRVVILGQDPYHGPGQANGLAFAVSPGVRLPPSLANIHRELASDCGGARPAGGDLSGWARQGVLLLNTSLTVVAGRAGSHARLGWGPLTRACLLAVAERPQPCVFILWGRHAQHQADALPRPAMARHCQIRSAHPSPLSAHAGFLGSRPFSRANAFLRDAGLEPVDWMGALAG